MSFASAIKAKRCIFISLSLSQKKKKELKDVIFEIKELELRRGAFGVVNCSWTLRDKERKTMEAMGIGG